ncbi:MAG: portal protein [Vicinamibacterales bacterium]
MARRYPPLGQDDGLDAYPDEGLDPAGDLETDTDRETTRDTAAKKKLHERLCKLFVEAADFGAKQRQREEEDLRFFRAQELEDQWPTEILRARGVGVDEGDETPERPCLMVETLKQPVNQIVNEARNSRIAVNLKHKGEASPDEAHLRQGLIRAIEADSNATTAYLDALERAAVCGTGNFRILTEYAADGDDDLDIVVSEIPDQASVYWGPAFKRDKSDAEVVFILECSSPADFRRRWPSVPLAEVREGHPLGDYLTTWVGEGVQAWAECYLVEMIEERVADPARPLLGRPRLRRTVRHILLNADRILEEVPYPGRYLPVCFMPGERHVIRGEVSYRGVVSSGKEPAKLANYLYSAAAEHIGLATKAPFTLDPRQIAGYEKYWEHANTVNWPYLPAKRVIDELPNVDLGAPKRNVEEPPIQATVFFLQHTLQAIMGVTGRHGPSLGQITEERSGKAIRELKTQGELGSSHFLHHLATVTIPYAAKVMNDLLFHVYNRPGRNARLLGDQPGDEEEILLGVPFTRGEDGRPQPAEEPGRVGGFLRQAGQMVSGLASRAMGRPAPAPTVQKYTLTEGGEYVVQASAGQSFQTQREENFAIVSEMLKTNPNMLPMFGDILAKYLDGPMATELSERFQMLNPALAQAGAMEQLPPEARALVMQAQQQVQQLQQQVQQAQMAVQTDQAKQQAQLQIAQIETQAQMQIKQAELQVRFRTEMAKIQAETAKTRATLQSKEELERFDAAVQQAMQAAEHQHEIDLQRLKTLADEEAARREEARAVRADVRADVSADRAEARKADAARRATEFSFRQPPS